MKSDIWIILSSFLLVGCNSPINFKSNQDFIKAITTYNDGDQLKPLNMQTLYANQGFPHLSSIDSQTALVVPLGFLDDNLQSIQNYDNLIRLDKVFNGSAEEIDNLGGFSSVSNYYQKSSYGKINFKADVLPSWVVYNGTSSDFYRKYQNKSILGLGACDFIKEFYVREYSKDKHGILGHEAKPLEYYDQNNDGFVDLLWIVYSHPSGTVADWWAYVSYTENRKLENDVEFQTFGFASIDWLDKGYNGYDTHIFIHETGHAFGLLDYYDYSENWSPLGKIDMMDSNIGDHNAFSKFTLGWLNPLIVDDSAIITLKSTSVYGECFIIPSPNYNNTAFDEYLMVEFITPEGLSYGKYNSYQNIEGFSEPGIRITHCDGRVFLDNHDTYLSEPEKGQFFRLSNTKGGREGLKKDSDYFLQENGQKGYYSLLSLIEPKFEEKNWITDYNYLATNKSLFKKNDSVDFHKKDFPQAKYLPSGTNLWNKAKTISGWKNNTTQDQIVDEKYIINYSLKVLDITLDENNTYKAEIQIVKY